MRVINTLLGYLLLLYGCYPLVGQAQAGGLPDVVREQVALQTDRELYISGETVWFNLYVFAGGRDQLSDYSKVAYLELLNPEGAAVARIKAPLENGWGAGAVKLPAAMNNGYYTLRAYTQAMRNAGAEAFAQISLIVLNPDQPLIRAGADPVAPVRKGTSARPVAPDRYLHIAVGSSETTFGQREAVTLEITTTDANGRPAPAQLSLSVAIPAVGSDTDPGLFRKMGTGLRGGSPATVPGPAVYPPETNGLRLHGRVVNQTTGLGESEAEVYLAFPGRTALVYMEKTDESGAFAFLLPTLYGLRQMVVQARPKDSSPLIVELADEFHAAPVSASETPFVLSPEMTAIARTALINAQVEKAYQAFVPPPVFTAKDPFDTIPFFGRADLQYVLDDYTRFPLPEFFFEVVPEVRVRGKYGSEELKLLNDWESPGGETPPLLLVDGVPVFDQRTFLKINNQLIASAEIITSPFWLNPVVFDGMIQLSSFEGDARCFTLPETAVRRSYLALLPQEQFATPDYDDDPGRRLPDFRNTLYWNPAIRTDENGKATVRFFTSDAPGEYVVRAEGVSGLGLLGSARAVLRVMKTAK